MHPPPGIPIALLCNPPGNRHALRRLRVRHPVRAAVVPREEIPDGKRRDLARLELAALKPMEYVIEMDGQRWETSAMLVAVGNGQSYGGGMQICPSAIDDDGQFDVTVIGETSVGRLVRVFPTIYKGRHVDYPRVNTYRARSVTLSTPDVTAYADGERFTPLPVTCECVPRAAVVLVPR